MKNGWSTEQRCINPLYAFGVFRVDLLYKVCLPSPSIHSATLVHCLNHSFFFSVSQLSPPLFIRSLPSISQSSHILVLPLPSNQHTKLPLSSSFLYFLALFLYMNFVRDANKGHLFTARHSPTLPSIQRAHKSASQHATGTKLECPAFMCPSCPLQDPTVSSANTHADMNAHTKRMILVNLYKYNFRTTA